MHSNIAVCLWIAQIPVGFFFWDAERWEPSLFQCSRKIAAVQVFELNGLFPVQQTFK